MPNSILGGLLGRLTSNLYLGSLLGSLLIWYFVDFLWIKFAGGHISVLAFALCFLALTLIHYLSRKELNQNAKTMMAGEQWALILLCIYTLFISDVIRWF